MRAGPGRERQEPDRAPHDLAVDLGDVGEGRGLPVVREQRLPQVRLRRVDLVQRLLVLRELADQPEDDGHVARRRRAGCGRSRTAYRAMYAGTATMGRMTTTRRIDTWLTDMDGVLVHEDDPIPGAAEFIETLKASGRAFLVLTNNSIYTPRDLRARLLRSGIDVPEDAIWTSALATADFLADQRPGGTAYVVGEAGLTTAMHDVGLRDDRPRPRLRRARRDPHLLLRGHHQGDPADRGGCAVHRDQPRPERAERRGPAAGHRLGRRPDQHRDRPPALLHRQAEPADDAQRPQPARGALRDHRHGRRPDGHRHHQRPRGGAAHRARLDRLDPTRAGRALPLPADPRRRLDRRPRAARHRSSAHEGVE